MGTIHHHAIIVEGYGQPYTFQEGDPFPLRDAHEKASEIFPWVSPISPAATNGSSAFFIPPDGSKEWWDASDQGNERRAEFIEWLRDKHLTWVEIGFGELGLSITDGSTRAEVVEA